MEGQVNEHDFVGGYDNLGNEIDTQEHHDNDGHCNFSTCSDEQISVSDFVNEHDNQEKHNDAFLVPQSPADDTEYFQDNHTATEDDNVPVLKTGLRHFGQQI